MKYLMTLLFTIGIAGSAVADTGWYYNEHRSGEGVVVTELEKRLVFSFYGYTGIVAIPPVVSPKPPFDLVCDMGNVWLIGDGVFIAGVAAGDLYFHEAGPLFPSAIDGEISDEYIIGEFIMESLKEGGYSLHMIGNGRSCNFTFFDKDFIFNTLIVK